jgi:hypothetical protein
MLGVTVTASTYRDCLKQLRATTVLDTITLKLSGSDLFVNPL